MRVEELDPDLEAILAKLSEEDRAKLKARDKTLEDNGAKRAKKAQEASLQAVQDQVLLFGKALADQTAGGKWRTAPYAG